MTNEQLLNWVLDNNVDEKINDYIKSNPKNSETIAWIIDYITQAFEDDMIKSVKLHEAMENPEYHTIDNIADMMSELSCDIEYLKDIDMIANYIEKHEPKK